MAAYAPDRPTEKDKALSNCSKAEMTKALKKMDTQCLLTKGEWEKKYNDTWTDIKYVQEVVTVTDESLLYVVLIGAGVVVFLLLIIVFLSFCLLSKRDLSCCPTQSNFGRRYSQMRSNARNRVRYNIPEHFEDVLIKFIPAQDSPQQ